MDHSCLVQGHLAHPLGHIDWADSRHNPWAAARDPHRLHSAVAVAHTDWAVHSAADRVVQPDHQLSEVVRTFALAAVLGVADPVLPAAWAAVVVDMRPVVVPAAAADHRQLRHQHSD